MCFKSLQPISPATTEHLNANHGRVHAAKFRDYAVANYHAAEKLVALVGDYLDYGEARETLELLSQKLMWLKRAPGRQTSLLPICPALPSPFHFSSRR